MVLDRKNIYIVPTQHGLLLACILLVMLVGSMNYNSSLGYLFTFLLISMVLVSILHTHRNLLGLRIDAGHVAPVFAGELAQFQLGLDNRDQPARHTLLWHRYPRHDDPIPLTINVPADQKFYFTLEVVAPSRGYLQLGQLIVYTRFPLGLFRAWSYVDLNVAALVYPAPNGQEALPRGQPGEQRGENTPHEGGTEDFIGYRAYQIGDSPRHVDWKAVAREQGWLVKQFGGVNSATIWLRWDDVKLYPLETALSQLCLWVVRAEHAGIRYGLELPNSTFEPNGGEQHQTQCLRALALFGLNGN